MSDLRRVRRGRPPGPRRLRDSGLCPTVLCPTVLCAVVVLALVAGAVLQTTVPEGSETGWIGQRLPLQEPGGGTADARLRSGAEPRRHPAALAAAASTEVAPLTALHPWVERGPTQVGGRITDLALSPDSATLFVASASGGLWTSRDGGTTMQSAWPAGLPPAIGAVGVLADGTVLAGTGEANAGGGSITFGGDGLHRSTDGGATWQPSGLPTSGTVARILAHPTDPTIAWVAAGGDLFRPGGERGIYRTTDGGRTWDRVLTGATPTTGGADLALDPDDPTHLLAAMWDRQRTPSARRYGGAGSGLYESRDAGTTWTPVTTGLSGFTPDAGRIAVAFSPADGRIAYAVVTRGDGRAGGLHRSDDGGTSWTLVNDGEVLRVSQHIFGWWFSKVFPAPDDPDRVLVPGLSLLESVDGGRTLAVEPRVHADQHALLWSPADPDRAMVGSDGGLYTSADGGRTGSWRPAQVQPFTQAYDAAVPPTAPQQVIAGFQDIGCRSDGGDDAWPSLSGCGDGVLALPHPISTTGAIVCGQYGRCWEAAAGRMRRLPMPDVARVAWQAPLVRLPTDPDHLLFGADRVHASDDAGATWRPISPDLTRGASPDPDYAYGTVSEVLPVDPAGRTLLAGTDDGRLWRTDDAGTTWALLVDGDRWITGIAASADGRVIAVGTSGYLAGDGTAQVARSTDGGRTWADAATGLPDAPVNDLLVAGGSLVAATDAGVHLWHDWADAPTPAWRRVGDGLPSSPALALDHLPGLGLLTVATFGRGIWQTTLPDLRRIAGADPFATAVAVSEEGTADAGARVIVLASADAPADALAIAPVVATRPGWTLLLVARDHLPGATAAALRDQHPDRLVVVGGPAAVTEGVAEAAASAAGVDAVRRIAGADRYATAAAIAEEEGSLGRDTGGTVLLASAGTGVDALTAAPLAAAVGAPVLLVDPDRLPDATAEALRIARPSRVIAVGGTAAIAEAVLLDAAAEAGGADGHPPRVERIAGPDRIATAALLARRTALEQGADRVWVAPAGGLVEVLAAAAAGGPVVLTGRDALDRVTAQAIAALAPRRVRLVGGEDRLSRAVEDALASGPPLGGG